MKSEAQQADTDFNICSSVRQPRNVSFCPAADNSSESSPIAEDLTAQPKQSLFPMFLNSCLMASSISGSIFSFLMEFITLKGIELRVDNFVKIL